MDPSIDRLQRRSAADGRVIGLAGGLPSDAQFPRQALARAFLGAITAPGAPALQYGWPEGSERLRRWIAQRLVRRGARVSANEVVITNGAQQAIALAAQLLCRPGTRVGVDPETYPAALDLFRTRGAVPTAGAAAVRYAMPAVTNPRGQTLGEPERRRLLEASAIIEDEAYAELRFAGPPPPPLLARNRDRVWHVGTFSKVLCPGLRVGWLVAPPRYRERVLRAKHDADLQANSLAQAVLEDFLERDDFDERLVALRRFYARRAARLTQAVRRHLPGWKLEEPEGGFALWVEPERDFEEVQFLEHAVRAGVSFDPGSEFRPDAASHPPALRLCFSAVPRLADLEEGVRRLARAWATFRG